MRKVLGALGVGVAAYGGWLLLSRTDNGQLLDAGIWLASGVVLHDFVLTLGVLVAGAAVAARCSPSRPRHRPSWGWSCSAP